MTSNVGSLTANRREQMFPHLETYEIERVRRFGDIKSFGAGDALAQVGKVGAGVIIVLGAVTVSYTLIGGIYAVVWTDVIQGIFLIGGGLLCIALIVFGSDAGPTEIVSHAWEGTSLRRRP